MNAGALVLVAVAFVLAGCGTDRTEHASGTGNDRMLCEVTPETSGEPPEIAPLAKGKTHLLVFTTNKGAFTVELDTKKAPCTTASMVQLAEKGFFNGTIIHRIVPGFVIQGGDPTGIGTGGPGYSTIDTPPTNARYTKGVVAMAKTMDEAPGTAGSQFFIVTGADAGLPPDYAIIGKVVRGLDVVERIGKLGGPDERPTQRVEIESVRAE